ncbi:MAG: polyketide synthase dehydratase domain-containing protein, partial [Dolichospermum sp.]
AKSWMVNGCEEIYPGYTYFSCQNFKVLKGITFNSTLAKEHILEIQEVAKLDGDFVEFQAKILSKNPEGKTHYHFSSLIKLVKNMPERPIYEAMDLREDHIVTKTGKDFYQNGDLSLFHGPAFQKITKVLNISPKKLTAECCWQEITAKEQGQFSVKWYNPYMIDLSTQTLWLWLNHIHQEVCLPGQLTYCEQFLAVPFNVPFYV